MKRTASVSILVICAAGIGALLLSCGTVAPQGDKDHKIRRKWHLPTILIRPASCRAI